MVNVSKRLRGKESEKGCNCGRKRTGGDVTPSCSSMGTNISRCPCFKANVPCSRACRCKYCANPNIGPSQGHNQKTECSCRNTPFSCKNTSARKSKCPCLRNNVSCSSGCKCKDCGNANETSNTLPSSNYTTNSQKRKRDNGETFKRLKGSSYLANEGFDISCGTWTELETTALLAIQEILRGSKFNIDVTNVSSLYRHLASSAIVNDMKLAIGGTKCSNSR